MRIVALVIATAAVAAAQAPVGSGRPDPNRFTPVTIVQPGELDEPMAFEVLPNGKVYIIERKGALKAYDPATKLTKTIETLPVNTKYAGADNVIKEAEEGLMGIALDPKFADNHFVYLLYAEQTVTKHVLARWELNEFDELVPESKKVLLEYGTQREVCCHTGGGMTWDAAGNLLLLVGDNTGVNLTAHTDERPGRANWDDQRTAANTNDLRGKILRIHPEPDGTYTIPAGNLFPPGTPGTRPEIYAMGLRNPWRVSIDSKTGYIYWGEIGPDAVEDSANGPRGYDEFNRAKQPGFFGWPYFIGDNQAYPLYDYAAKAPGAKKDPAKPTNTSVNNTGLRELPPAQAPMLSYPYALSTEFPLLGTGARAAVGGPIYHRADRPNAARPFPEYYEGKWLVADLSRGWIMSIAMNANGDLAGVERFLSAYQPVEPIDIKFGPDGDLYVLEYGSNWFRKSNNARLVRIEYNAGNRPPIVRASASAVGGVAPLKVTLSSKGTADPDGDAVKYEWSVEPEKGGAARKFTTPTASVTFDKRGVYFATLTVTDAKGASADQLLTIVAGNEPPKIDIDVAGNQTFYFPNEPVNYKVAVTDREDGVAPAEKVAFSIDQVGESFDVSLLAQGDAPVDGSTRFAVAKAIMGQSDCRNCHNVDSKSNGPSWDLVADKYKGDAAAQEKLAEKIRAGGRGVWPDLPGEGNMPAHPGLSIEETRSIVQYVMNIKNEAISGAPLAGTFAPTGTNKLVLRAVYTDAGAKDLASHTVERVTVRRSPIVSATSADDSSAMMHRVEGNGAVETMAARPGGYLVWRGIDLTGIRQVEISASVPAREGFKGGTVEVRTGSVTGELLGQFDVAATTTAPGVITLKTLTGPRDLYLVVRNATAKPDDMLVSIATLAFQK
ncbi:MAG: PKD domain-containing protein [Acidobacteria bacterium]|nr:MAG: PKD domain-containing protein [Acidobacteriota bacterium]